MRILLCLLALMIASPTLAEAQDSGWAEVGRPSYERNDYGRSGPTPRYYAPGSFVMYAAPGPQSYSYSNGVRVWYGNVPEFAPVLTTAPVLLPQGPAVAAPASPGPRVYRQRDGVRYWYGPGQ